VAVDSTYRGKNIGLKLIRALKEIAVLHECYKVTLDCKESSAPFYEKVT